jgi:hypothetical protein
LKDKPSGGTKAKPSRRAVGERDGVAVEILRRERQ